MAGKIYLVGAGPGDPGLLTLKGRRCLREADVVIYDYLANPALLEHAPASAERVLVGKHGGGSRVDQGVINELIVGYARAGKNVVRLKGGDPFIFGRGGEEAEAAAAAGVAFEIVPGVTSAIAVPAYAGIPLTHRELASNVIFTTGYEYPSKPEIAVHWQELARSGSTLVILMTQRQLRSNLEQLIAAGLRPTTPAAVIEWGTRTMQRTLVATVATLADRADAEKVKPPALAIVGDVVGLRQRLSWFERKPLFGRRIVITRPRHQAAELADRLEREGAEVVLFPTIEIVAPESYAELDRAFAAAPTYDWLIFTSANGVRVFLDRLTATRHDIRAWQRAKIAAIGSQTAALLEAHHLTVAAVPEQFRAEGLVEMLGKMDLQGKRILLPRAQGARPLLPEQLRARGAQVDEVITYRSLPARKGADEVKALLAEDAVDVVTFTSSSTVQSFVAAMGPELSLGRAAVACIGPITSVTARQHGLTPAIEPSTFTVAALAEAIVRHLHPLTEAVE